MADKIVSLGKFAENSKMITPEQCLRDCLENDIGKRTAFSGKKIIIIALNDEDGKYSFGFNQAGFKVSEIICLLSIIKKHFISLMGF